MGLRGSSRGEEAEDWQVANGLVLLNDPDDPPTSFSRRWPSSPTPDLAFATSNLSRIASRTVPSQLGGSDHKPIKISLNLQYRPQRTSTLPSGTTKDQLGTVFFSILVDQLMPKINNKRQFSNTKIKVFNQAVLKAVQESIPRGARKKLQAPLD